jgi:hypothetical protein
MELLSRITALEYENAVLRKRLTQALLELRASLAEIRTFAEHDSSQERRIQHLVVERNELRASVFRLSEKLEKAMPAAEATDSGTALA